MENDRSGGSPFAYRQWDDNPTWCLDRGRDDHHNDPPDVPVGVSAVSGFHAAIVSQREKHAQATDAAVAFIGFKKTAGIMQAAKSLGGMAMKHPHAAGAAIGAAGGAIAGGPNHRLGGAVAGGALGAAAGGAIAKPAGRALNAAADRATASEVKSLGQMHAPTPAARPEPGGVTQVRQLNAQKPQMYGAPNHAKEVGAIKAQQMGAGSSPAATAGTQLAQPAPAMAPGLANQSPAALDAARREMAAGGGKNMMGVGQAPAVGPAPGYVKPPAAQTMVMQKQARLKKASLPPFPVADDSLNAASSGELSVKTGELIGELASEAAEHIRPRVKPRIPASAVLGFVDDAAQLGRNKIQAEISRHTRSQLAQNPEEPQPKVASPYDSTPLFDAKQRAADRYPEKVSPIEAIRTDFKSAMNLIQDKVKEIGQNRGLVKTSAKLPTEILNRFIPRQARTAEGLGVAIGGGLIGAGAGFLASRGKAEHGGKSQAEVDTKRWKDNQPEETDGIRATITKHMANMHADVAERMRKHPVASTAFGGLVGAGTALRLAPLMGIGSHIK